MGFIFNALDKSYEMIESKYSLVLAFRKNRKFLLSVSKEGRKKVSVVTKKKYGLPDLCKWLAYIKDASIKIPSNRSENYIIIPIINCLSDVVF